MGTYVLLLSARVLVLLVVKNKYIAGKGFLNKRIKSVFADTKVGDDK